MSLETPDTVFDVEQVLRSESFRSARLAGRLRWLLLRRATSESKIPLSGRLNALRQKAERFSGEVMLSTGATPCRWLPVGPRNINGRIRCLAIHPTDGNILYAGAADGGVWKTIDGGQSWEPLTDDKDSLSIGALAIDPSAPDTVYVGTGEPMFFAGLGAYAWDYPGIGVLKSTDAGKTWSPLGAIQNQYIYRIAVDPHDPWNLLCAGFAADGAGGLCRWNAAGNQWDLVQSGVFTDALFDPVNPGLAYAGKYDDGVWKSTDSGVTWSQRSTGLPLLGSGRVSVTLARQLPAVLHARVESSGLVYRTTTSAEPSGGGGTAWTQLPDPGADVGADLNPLNQRYWCSYVAADPLDPAAEIVYVGGIDLVRRERNSSAQLVWTRISPTYNPPDPRWVTHSDHHDIAFVPGDSTRFYVATDGGVFLGQYVAGTVPPTPPVQWHKVSTGLAVTQFYDLGTSATTPSMFGGGCQDNGTVVTTGGLSWRHVYGGDGSYLAFHSADPWTIWAVRWAGGPIVQRSKDGGASFEDAQGTGPNRISGGGELPVVLLAMDPATPATLFAGTNRIWRTVNGDAVPATSIAWSPRTTPIATITEITIASPTVVYFGTIDGRLYFSKDGGTTFSEITPSVAGWPTNRWLSGITIRSGTPPTMFATFYGFNSALNVSNHVWMGVFDPSAGPNGAWTTAMTSISSNLPNAPVAALVVDPTTPSTLYVATDVGVYRSVDEGASWTSFGEGLPNVAVVDLAVDPTRGLLRAATHGRSMFQRSLAPSCPPIDIYLCDNLLDTGEVFPSPSGVPDPTRLNERAYHWQSASIKVDAPPFQPVDALVDGVEFDNPTHRKIPFGPPPGYPIETVAGITHENPIRSVANRVYVQAHNRGPSDAADVEVRLLWADAGAALPPLPADFWTGFATDSYTQTVWHLIGNQSIPTLAAGVPQVLRFDWTPPATTSDHVCLLALLHCASDPLLPETQLVVDLLTRSNKRVTHKNVHPVNLAAVIAGRPVAWPWLRFYNPYTTTRLFTFRLETSSPGDWTVAMVLPRVELQAPVDASVYGFRHLALENAQCEAWLAEARASGALSTPLSQVLSHFRDPLVLLVDAGQRVAGLRGVHVHPGRPVPAVFVATRPRAATATRLRLDVLQLDGDRLLGGSTFLVDRDE
jgi:photosystem II stability/assembly factor-like uncharacterized protein